MLEMQTFCGWITAYTMNKILKPSSIDSAFGEQTKENTLCLENKVERTRRAGVKVPSTSKRQMVFLIGRASRGEYTLPASVMIYGRSQPIVKQQRRVGDRKSTEIGLRSHPPFLLPGDAGRRRVGLQVAAPASVIARRSVPRLASRSLMLLDFINNALLFTFPSPIATSG